MVEFRKKIHSKKIRTRLNDYDDSSVDSRMLDMLKQLEDNKNQLGFYDKIAEHSEKILGTLQMARVHLKNTDNIQLEESALALSNHALRVGAANLLKYSFELQNVARYQDFAEAELIVDNLEAEYQKVRRDLEKIV